jgi:hypothetical protein
MDIGFFFVIVLIFFVVNLNIRFSNYYNPNEFHFEGCYFNLTGADTDSYDSLFHPDWGRMYINGCTFHDMLFSGNSLFYYFTSYSGHYSGNINSSIFYNITSTGYCSALFRFVL